MRRMSERALNRKATKGIEDLDAFAEACAVFGEANALARLQAFRADISAQLDRVRDDVMDKESLREMAHQTAGRAGLLGFPTLAEASARLDEAIRANTALRPTLDLWTTHARLATQDAADPKKNDSQTPS